MPSAGVFELFRPEDLARIDDYALIARCVVDGVLAGLHRSVFQGGGSEFFQYRAYTPGDDLKLVDWKATARLDRPYIRRFQEETNMHLYLVLDTSASMGYRGDSSPCSKLRYAAMAAACFGMLARRQGDAVGLFTFAETLGEIIPPMNRAGHIQRVFAALADVKPGGAARPGAVAVELARLAARRGVVVILSDLIDWEESAFEHLLRLLRAAGCECVVVQVLDPDETTFPFSGGFRFVDPESGRSVVTAPETVRSAYIERFQRFLAGMRLIALRQEADLLQAETRDNLGLLLAAYLHGRGARS